MPSDAIIDLRNKHIDLFYEIEHLCSCDVWEGWKDQDLVSVRSDKEMRAMFDHLIPRNKSLDVVIDELVQNTAVRDTILTFEPKKLKKKSMAAYLRDQFGDRGDAYVGFERTIKEIERFFSV